MYKDTYRSTVDWTVEFSVRVAFEMSPMVCFDSNSKVKYQPDQDLYGILGNFTLGHTLECCWCCCYRLKFFLQVYHFNAADIKNLIKHLVTRYRSNTVRRYQISMKEHSRAPPPYPPQTPSVAPSLASLALTKAVYSREF